MMLKDWLFDFNFHKNVTDRNSTNLFFWITRYLFRGGWRKGGNRFSWKSEWHFSLAWNREMSFFFTWNREMRFLRDLWIAFFSLREIVNLEVYEIPETHIFSCLWKSSNKQTIFLFTFIIWKYFWILKVFLTC